MKTDEFAFFNQQLAAMVRDGIPLESALRRLCTDMRRGKLRTELEKLEADLAKGIPLRDAVRDRQLPELYRQMLEIAAASNDLPGILTMLADHYERQHTITTRLKGLMVYPAIVLVASFILSGFLCILMNALATMGGPVMFLTPEAEASTWIAPTLLTVSVVVFFLIICVPRFRRAMRWKIPGFKDNALARIASAIALMLKSGVPFDHALEIAAMLERGTPAESEFQRWRQQLASGRRKFREIAPGSMVFPPLFVWTVSAADEDLAQGFQSAARLYTSRADSRSENLLYVAMPCCILCLGLVILSQVLPSIFLFFSMVETAGENGNL